MRFSVVVQQLGIPIREAMSKYFLTDDVRHERLFPHWECFVPCLGIWYSHTGNESFSLKELLALIKERFSRNKRALLTNNNTCSKH